MPAPSSSNPNEPDLLTPAEPHNDSSEDLDLELKQQQQRLIELQRQQEEIQRRKQELETLNQKRQRLIQGQRDTKEKISQALSLLERAEQEALREIDTLRSYQETLGEHLERISSFTPSEWSHEELKEKTTPALADVEKADSAYNKCRTRVDSLGNTSESFSEDYDDSDPELSPSSLIESAHFLTLVWRGLAFTLPLIVVLILLSLLFLVT